MSELLILALLIVGKIHSQEVVVSEVNNNLRDLRAPAFDRRPVPYQEYMGLRTSRPPLRLYTNPPRPADRDLPQKVNLPLTVRENQPERKLFVSSEIKDKMNRPSYNNNPVNNTEYYSNDVYEDIYFDNNRTPESVIKPAITQKTVNMKSVNVTTVKPDFVNANIPNNRSIPEISLDERSSFNGDPCPVGFAKINGQCVKADR